MTLGLRGKRNDGRDEALYEVGGRMVVYSARFNEIQDFRVGSAGDLLGGTRGNEKRICREDTYSDVDPRYPVTRISMTP